MSEGSILAFLSYAGTILHEKKKTPSLSAIPSLKFDAILASANKLQVSHVIWVTRSSKSKSIFNSFLHFTLADTSFNDAFWVFCSQSEWDLHC